MRYELVRSVYIGTRYPETRERWRSQETYQAAGRLQDQMNESKLMARMGYRDYVKKRKRFEELLRALEDMDRYCLDSSGEILPQECGQVRRFFQKDEEINACDCFYFFFLIVEREWFFGKNRAERSEAANRYRELFADMMREGQVNYDPRNSADPLDIFFRYVLGTGQKFAVLWKLCREWDERQASDNSVRASLELGTEWNMIAHSVRELTDILAKGLEYGEEYHRKTQASIQLVDEEVGNLIRIKLYNWETEDSLDLFPEILLQHALNTQARRQWYFYSLLEKIMLYQIGRVQDCYEEYLRNKNADTRTLFQDSLRGFWGELRAGNRYLVGKTLSQVGERPDFLDKNDISPERLQEALLESRINQGRILNGFNEAYDNMDRTVKVGMRPAIFLEYRGRLERHFKEADLEDDQIPAREERAGNSFLGTLLRGKKLVSREMLLLTALLAKAYGVDISESYVSGHILYNCRLGRKLHENCFERFFEETFRDMESMGRCKRMFFLREKAWEMEETYLKESGKPYRESFPVYRRILEGKRVW